MSIGEEPTQECPGIDDEVIESYVLSVIHGAVTEWKSQGIVVSSRSDEQGNIRLTGSANSDAWLIQSPPIVVPANERLALSLPTEPARAVSRSA